MEPTSAVGVTFEFVLLFVSICWAVISLILFGMSSVSQFSLSWSRGSVSGNPNSVVPLPGTTKIYMLFLLFSL